jgi:uncharacterized membrane protein
VNRLLTLSDAVVAIAHTLLVLQLRVLDGAPLRCLFGEALDVPVACPIGR